MIAEVRSPLKRNEMRILHVLGVLFIAAWLVLWLAVKVTFAAIHVLVVVGILFIVAGLFAGRSATAK
jgi:thiosulfate reductase cytochrome b subunit